MQKINVEFDVPVLMRDGTILRANVSTPAGDGPYPVLVERTPYDKNAPLAMGFEVLDAARAGYIVVRLDTRGSGSSDGEWLPWKYEREDGYDTVEWASSLPKSNGKVGMFGGSYNGSTQWSSAIARAPGLAAIAPMVTWADPEDGLLFRGGATELGINAFWSIGMALSHFHKVYPPDEASAKAKAAFPHYAGLNESIWALPSAAQPYFVELGMPDLGVARAFEDRSTTDDSRVAGRYDQIIVPSLNFAGWYDVFQQGALDNYSAMRARGVVTRLIVGPWMHTSTISAVSKGEVGEVNFGPLSLMPGGEPISKLHFDWYDHWLKGSPATSAHASGVLIFVMGAHEWRAEPDWPLARAITTPLYLAPDSTLRWELPEQEGGESKYVYDPANPVITRGGNLFMDADYPAGPFDQREVEGRDDVLVFTTEAFEGNTEITGRIRATLSAVTDGPSTDWVVRLCEVDNAGVSRNIVDGITRVHSEPGRVDEVSIDLWSTSILIKAGHRLRVHVTSSNFPRWDRNLNTGEREDRGVAMRVAKQRILHDSRHPSRVDLPISPG
ncbi:CocE/NonD family hydrolase [Stenotrophomonas sp. CFBP8980]|uniref:CocE/NonD family hydrolase n=1 Tax=Stenotrophomonas sp. CFBP8980 TaxID=3096523 RepID=UPI002A6ADA50|nr:CocE/NonD family hydrolase [Stenotrophomonas sp. CFBP8980]MDY1033028.1 CocE/NonD family hydrolase [Stenotrophomonas sp. CFBP8980]